MLLLDQTLATPEENLALDEALLDVAEQSAAPCELLRLWEPACAMVVVGRSSRYEQEVRVAACRSLGVPVLRRTSGGAAIVTGPGCLMYAVVLSYRNWPHLRAIDEAHRFVLGNIAAALARSVPDVAHQGTSDLTLRGRKFSGNSLRCRRENMLYHGTLLYDFPLELIDCCLPMPARQPHYRQGRPHDAFVTNLPLPREVVRAALIEAWSAHAPLDDWPRDLTVQLARDKYSDPAWNMRL